MSVAQSVQSFAGIANENEFYGHHYLAEVFKGDIRSLIESWEATEEAAAADEDTRAAARAPHKRLGGLAGKWFAALAGHGRLREDIERLESHRQMHTSLFEALGYKLTPQQVELQRGMPIPVWAAYGEAHQAPSLLIVPAYQPGREDEDPLDQKLTPAQYDGQEVPELLKKLTWLEIASEALFGADQPPRFIILVGFKEWLLIDRYKWPNNRLLRFDWTEILDRKDTYTLQAAAALLHHESLAPQQGASLLDGLDENAHKHAFGVSEDLKYALRESIEILGNEAVQQLRKRAQERSKGFYTGKDAVDPGELSLECLRLVYRLLFMFYIEARPELGYVPIQKSETYAKGYSLESLRDLELIQLNTQTSRDGMFFDATLRKLFSIIAQGCGAANQATLSAASVKEAFALAPLDSKLFDPAATPMLNEVHFPNHVWQQVVRLMSLSSGKRKGRVSYQLLSINQLGAVYEALLSYRGFFASEDLYEVKPEEKKKAKAAAEEDGDDEDDEGEDADESSASDDGGTSTDVMDSAWFVPKSRIDQYKASELVHDIDDQGHKKLRVYPRDTFIYRLAGRDREKSASYYTPQVLTRCLVKYALKELLKDKTADEILKLTVVEPAMGSAAFLNEAVNQLSEAYLERKQAELKRRIPHDQYTIELQKTRMYIADRNVFGVDLNPVATELAEVSLWLNAIYGEPTKPGELPKAARVPWFGYQLFTGNSLIGARREVYPAGWLRRGCKPPWYELIPRRLDPQSLVRKDDEIYHFLLPDPGMGNYTDEVAKQLYKADFERLKIWHEAIKKPLEQYEISRLLQLSEAIDKLWAEHAEKQAEDRAKTEDPLALWPAPPIEKTHQSRTEKEEIRIKGLLNRDDDLATPYRRLKLVMDYWCSLWFWPITQSADLPSREQWWMEIGAILEGNIVDLAPQIQMDFTEEVKEVPLIAEERPTLFGPDQMRLTVPVSEPKLHDKFGQLRIAKLRQSFPRVKDVEAIAEKRHFIHWQLTFADVFAHRGGFDLVLGNPPWLKVEWNEAGILGEVNPLVAIRKLNATELAKQRSEAFAQFPGLQAEWTNELEEAKATQNFLGAIQNYPLLTGMKINLYRCFIPTCWMLAGVKGIVGLLHPEGPYDDTKGGCFRQAIYPRLRLHFQFVNEEQLFSEVGHQHKFSINIYGPAGSEIKFDHIANLFNPITVDACYTHDGSGEVGGYKTSTGKWNTEGHADRIIHVLEDQLCVFATLYDEPGTSIRATRIPALHTASLSSVLGTLATYPRRLSQIEDAVFASYMWDENGAQRDGTIVRNADRSAPFAQSAGEWILSGPHFFVANPFSKTPRAICSSKGQYDALDLERLPDNYLPRTNYRPAICRDEYNQRIPSVPWSEKERLVLPWDRLDADEQTLHIAKKFQSVEVERFRQKRIDEHYRLVFRRRLSVSGERTLLSAIAPLHCAHVHSVQSAVFRDLNALIISGIMVGSLIGDFYIKSAGRNDLYDAWTVLPLIQSTPHANLAVRYLALNCLTTHYASLWAESYSVDFNAQSWSQPTNRRLQQDFFACLTSSWHRNCALRTDYARRLALLEIDVLVAQALNLTQQELLTIYRVQFAVMQGYERDTWYDIQGRIIYTNSKGLAGAGLSRKASRSMRDVTVTYPNGRSKTGKFGWDDILQMQQAGTLPDGSTVTTTVLDDTQPGGPRTRAITYRAPFALANREEDYRIAWEFFQSQAT